MKVRTLLPALRETPETIALREQVRDFLDRARADGVYEPIIDGWHVGWNRELSKMLADQGWVGMTIPVEFGGQGRGYIDRFVVTEELVAAGAPVAAHWVGDRQTAPTILRFGSDELKHSLLPRIATTELTFAIGMSEPDSGSDLANARTKATKVDGGWTITGTKLWSSGAHLADAMLVFARSGDSDSTDRHAGFTQFIVSLDSPGLKVVPIRWMSGGAHFNEVVFDRVFVPDGLVLGEVGNGWEQVTSELDLERSGPERFLSSFPLLRELVTVVAESDGRGAHQLGRLIARSAGIHSMSMAVSGGLARGEPVGAAGSAVKVIGGLTEGDIVEVAQYLLGDNHVIGNSSLVAMLDSGLVQRSGFTLRGGTTEILHGVIARELGMR